MLGTRRVGKVRWVAALAATLCLTEGTPVTVSGEEVPFQGTFSGTAQFTSQTTAAFEGSGNATHLGSSSNSCAITITGPPDANGCLPNINVATLTAANGDQLVLEMHDLACPIAPPAPVFHGTGNWLVIGGTGRFAGASGSGTVDGMGDFVSGTFEFTLTGTIDRKTTN